MPYNVIKLRVCSFRNISWVVTNRRILAFHRNALCKQIAQNVPTERGWISKLFLPIKRSYGTRAILLNLMTLGCRIKLMHESVQPMDLRVSYRSMSFSQGFYLKNITPSGYKYFHFVTIIISSLRD